MLRRVKSVIPLRRNTSATLVVLLFLTAGLSQNTQAQERISTQGANDAVALNNRGLALYQKGKVDDAIALFRQALAINPTFPEALSNLGTALDAKGQDDEAVTDFNKALTLKPTDAVSESNLGLALYHEKKYYDSISAYQKAIALNP
jgi:tetratricopeptide (TPR) repeat protein